MIYFDGNRWRPFKKRVSYTERVVDYDNDISRFEGKRDLIVEDLVLTEEQLSRLEIIAHVTTMSLSDIIKYINGQDLAEAPSEDLIRAEEQEAQREAIKELIDLEASPVEALERMKILHKDYKVGDFYREKDLILFEGGLYVVIQPHTAQEDWRPDQTPALYVERRAGQAVGQEDGSGAPDPWRQPAGAHDAYMMGDRVLWTDGSIYVSTIDNNVWSPGIYPQGWRKEKTS